MTTYLSKIEKTDDHWFYRNECLTIFIHDSGTSTIGHNLSSGGLFLFFAALFKCKCTKCINFPCGFNRVPKNIIDSNLRRNPVVANAWEDAGWRIDEIQNSLQVHERLIFFTMRRSAKNTGYAGVIQVFKFSLIVQSPILKCYLPFK